MTCKDCIYEPQCVLCISYSMDVDEGTGIQLTNMEERCGSFKNRADFVEVKRGEWIATASTHISKRGRITHYNRYKCSECGVWNGRHKPNYCPKCGAKMDGERK